MVDTLTRQRPDPLLALLLALVSINCLNGGGRLTRFA
jgi:hypothetical protein